jgi:hypothetical protein
MAALASMVSHPFMSLSAVASDAHRDRPEVMAEPEGKPPLSLALDRESSHRECAGTRPSRQAAGCVSGHIHSTRCMLISDCQRTGQAMRFGAEWWAGFGLVFAVLGAIMVMFCWWMDRRTARFEAEDAEAQERLGECFTWDHRAKWGRLREGGILR